MKVMKLKAKSGSTKVIFSDFEGFISTIRGRTKVLLVTDKNVLGIYGDKMNDLDMIVLEPGESAKTLRSVERIYEYFLEHSVDRSSKIVGVGGGTVSDVTGFAASTFMRGIPFGFAPTTLLAQVDASIGGKNGVNFRGFKNMIGTVRQPEFCLIDFSFLKTLPSDQLMSGMAEVIKCGVILNSKLFEYVEENHSDILSLDDHSLAYAVSETISAKINVVGKDETDNGERMKLNFGHTVGHAIEKVAGLPHGYSIAIGMVAESRLSARKGFLPIAEALRIEELLKAIGLPTRSGISGNDVLEAISKDKKSSGDSINIALPEMIGNGIIYKIKKRELKYAVQEVCK
jgi:3-dehydroquinate synthase